MALNALGCCSAAAQRFATLGAAGASKMKTHPRQRSTEDDHGTEEACQRALLDIRGCASIGAMALHSKLLIRRAIPVIPMQPYTFRALPPGQSRPAPHPSVIAPKCSLELLLDDYKPCAGRWISTLRWTGSRTRTGSTVGVRWLLGSFGN
jgi:hypothetical protein